MSAFAQRVQRAARECDSDEVGRPLGVGTPLALAIVTMEDTLIVRRVELRPPRRSTTQFAIERPAARWPWFCVLAIVALAAMASPIDATRDTRLAHEATQVLPLLP